MHPIIVRPVQLETEADSVCRATRHPGPTLPVGEPIEVLIGGRWLKGVVTGSAHSAVAVRLT
jgi:hypothetical protein